MNSKVIAFPEKEFIVKCKYCKTNVFYIHLNSDNPYDIKGYECAECERYWPIEYIELKREQVENCDERED